MTGIDISAPADKDDELPVLTDTVDTPIVSAIKPSALTHRPSADELVKLESKLCAKSLTLADQMIHAACRDVEDVIVERVMSKLRSQLPALVSRVLHDHFDSKE